VPEEVADLCQPVGALRDYRPVVVLTAETKAVYVEDPVRALDGVDLVVLLGYRPGERCATGRFESAQTSSLSRVWYTLPSR